MLGKHTNSRFPICSTCKVRTEVEHKDNPKSSNIYTSSVLAPRMGLSMSMLVPTNHPIIVLHRETTISGWYTN